jgi:hypothetical protein
MTRLTQGSPSKKIEQKKINLLEGEACLSRVGRTSNAGPSRDTLSLAPFSLADLR